MNPEIVRGYANWSDFSGGLSVDLNRTYVPFLGVSTSVFLSYILSVQGECHCTIEETEDDGDWIYQDISWAVWLSGLSERMILRARDKLLRERLLRTKPVATDRFLCLSPNSERLEAFCAFAYVLYQDTNPDSKVASSRWLKFAREAPEVIRDFEHLCPPFYAHMLKAAKQVMGEKITQKKSRQRG